MADIMMHEHAVHRLQENSIQHNKVVDSFVANTAKTAANFISGYAISHQRNCAYARMPACSKNESFMAIAGCLQ